MLRSQRAALVVAGVLCTVLAAPAGALADGGLNPGGTTRFKERVAVNVVFVGFNERDAPWNAVRSELASRGEPIVRSRSFYGIDERLGLDYSYDYKPYYTSKAWEDGFFGYLSSIAIKKPLTEWQQAYNDNARNVLDVTDNRWIDAPKVEKRLIDAAPSGVDTRQPTIFFINWYGRSDFRFHVYSKAGEPDPDTGTDFGATRDSRKIVAWGGTTPDDEETGLGRSRGTHRVWFYDLSAGPESWGGNFDVDNADLDGDDVADYRIPVSWEYGSYRPKSQLPHDLGKVVRYVGLDLLFTSSPLYPPYYTADRDPGQVDLDSNTVEGLPGVDASREFIKRDLFLQEQRELPTGYGLSADYQDLAYSGDFKRCFEGEFGPTPFSCFPKTGLPPDANLFLAAAFNQKRFLEGDGDYEAALINFSTDNETTPLGYADDNWVDGTQSGVFSFISPGIVDLGYGLTTTMIHEYGHHSSMSHPHDGYDPATGVDYEPTGDFFFAWLGDESNSIMSYLDVNWDFSQFDRDNSARHHAGGYALIANRIARDILRDRDARKAAGDLAAADRELGDAQDALENHDYAGMLAHSAKAYGHVRAGAARAGVSVKVRQPNTWTVLPAPRVAASGTQIEPSLIDLAPPSNRKRALP
jgi:hypothetical protein